jgi:hypothetical protein
MSSARHRLNLFLAAAGLTVGALTLSGCSAISDLFPEEAARDTDTQEISEAGEADVFTLAVGDCFDAQEAEEISSVPALPCTEPHDYEAYHSFDIPEAEVFPGEEAIDTAALDGCVTAFDPFIGMGFEESTLDVTYIGPTEGSWDEGDREIMCVVMGPEKTEGSLAGSAI